MVNSVVYRCTVNELLLERKMLNVDTLVMILGRPNYHRCGKTGGGPNEEVTDPALMILNGWCHRQLRAQKYDHILTNTKVHGFTAGT